MGSAPVFWVSLGILRASQLQRKSRRAFFVLKRPHVSQVLMAGRTLATQAVNVQRSRSTVDDGTPRTMKNGRRRSAFQSLVYALDFPQNFGKFHFQAVELALHLGLLRLKNPPALGLIKVMFSFSPFGLGPQGFRNPTPNSPKIIDMTATCDNRITAPTKIVKG